ncbi:MAG: hypothetical protein ACTSP3_08750 [Candidatus Heimdallarchaeaceae archaeon]
MVKQEYIFYFLYLLSGAEIIIGLIFKAYFLTIICLSFTITALLFRAATLFRFEEKPQKKMDWEEIRTILSNLLIEKNILVEKDNKTVVSTKETTLIDTLEDIKDPTLLENQELIIKIRELGVDGLLCLILLLQQEPAITSVRVIHKILKIPKASLYRYVSKLQQQNLISPRYIAEQPEKAFYKITDKGTSVIIQLYEILKTEIDVLSVNNIRGIVADSI